jgi:hypothetical protein
VFTGDRDTNTQLNHGELVVPSPVFLVLEVQAPTDPAKVLLVTSAERDVCSLPSAPGENGTEKSTPHKRDMQLHQLLQLQHALLLFSLVDPTLMPCQSFLLLLTLSTLTQPRLSLLY